MTPESLAADVQDALLPALEQSFLAVVLVDEHDCIRFFNQAAEQLWGYPRGEVMGHNMRVLLPESLHASHGAYVNKHREGGQPRVVGMNRDLLLERKDGRRLWAAFALSKVDMAGRIGYMALAYDVTEKVARQDQNRLLLMAVNHTDRAVLVLDQNRRIVQTNRAFTDMTGYEAIEVMGKVPSDFLASPRMEPDTLERVRRWSRENLRFQEELLTVRKDGTDVWVKVSVTPVFAANGTTVENLVVMLSDTTEERHIWDVERDVLAALTSGASFLEVGDYLCRCVESIAPGVLVWLDRVVDDAIQPWAAPRAPADAAALWRGLVIGDGVAGGGAAAYRGKPVLVKDIASDPAWTQYRGWANEQGLKACWSYPVRRRNGKVCGALTFYFHEPRQSDAYLERIADASVRLCALAIEREESRQEVTRLVQFDALTGLPNRSQLNRCVDELLSAGAVQDFAVLCLDLDRFGDVNNTLGHAVGDQVLVGMANRLRTLVHAGDWLCRTESDQYVVVAPRCDMQRAARMADHLLQAVGQPIDVAGHQLILSASMGISHYPNAGRSREALLSSAENAMSRAKKSGGGRSQFFNPEMNRIARDRLLLGAALKRAVANGGLYLQYQPQVRPGSGELYGVEALARWHDAEYGEIPPGKFIGLAEEIGEIETLGRWALREACRQMAAWRSQGVDVPVVSVNQSPFNFRSRDLPAFIAAALREHDLPGECLTIEITESTMMSLTPEMRGVMDAIRGLGVGLSVDDFGTGYSSLSNLANLPVTEVKIDRSFVGKGLQERRMRALVEAVVGIGRSLGLTVVAEGVETQDQRDWLNVLACPVVQGYLLCKPIMPDALQQWLSQGGAERTDH